MINAINDFLDEQLVNGYRLIDGNYIIALEERYDTEEDTFYLLDPVQFDYDDSGRGTFKPWIHTDSEEAIPLQAYRILTSVQTSHELKIAYNRYNLISNLSSVMTNKEIDAVLNQLFPDQVDSLDSSVNGKDLSVDDSEFYEWRSNWNN
jgi:hypothetical protein